MRSTPRTLEAIKQDVQRFADWYRYNKPSNDVIRLSREDLNKLEASKAEAKHYGFVFGTGGVTFGKFSLLLTPQEEAGSPQKRNQRARQAAINSVVLGR